jgi:hypothetical protein
VIVNAPISFLPPFPSEEGICGLLSAKGGLMMGTKRWGLSPARKRKPTALYGAESKKASEKNKIF